MLNDAIWSAHLDLETCGVARFNQGLAGRLGIPCVRLHTSGSSYPLVSVKPSELAGSSWAWPRCLPTPTTSQPYDLFLHDAPDQHLERLSDARLKRCFVANDELVETLRPWRPVLYRGWCPGTLGGDVTRGSLRIWTYGMAHKVHLPWFRCLKEILDRTPEAEDYTILQSVAVHAGTPWELPRACVSEMRALFGTHLRWLGLLADDAIRKELRDAHAVALFYEPAARANHTTLWSALEMAGPVVLTNLDQYSPSELRHSVSVIDIEKFTEWPDASERRTLRYHGREAAKQYGWDRLVGLLKSDSLS